MNAHPGLGGRAGESRGRRAAADAMFAVARVVALALALAASAAPLASQVQTAPRWEAYAVRYGTLASFPVAGLVAGADTTRRMDIALMVWLLREPGGRTVLVDAGFKRRDLLDRWKPSAFTRPDSALLPLGVHPADVTDIIVTHVHWDHLDGADLFPNARVWLQREEVEHHVDEAGGVRDHAIDAPGAAMVHALRRDGRLHLVDGDAREVLPGITAYTGGKHTYQSQYVAVRTGDGTVVIASDNAYLYENLDQARPIAQTLDAASNLAAQRRMLSLASTRRLVVPGHDPAVFERFPQAAANAVRLR